MRYLWLICCVLSGLAAAEPVMVFDDDLTPDDGRLEGSRVTIGGGAEQGYRALDPAAVARQAQVAQGTALPTVAGGYRDSAQLIRIDIRPGDIGWWSAELPLPETARKAVANLRRPALVFAIRGAQGHEAVEVGLSGGSPRVAVRIPLDRYGAIDRLWTIYRVPLSDFTDLVPELGPNQLQSILFFSSRPGPISLDLDAIRFEADSGPSGSRMVEGGSAARPAQPPVQPEPPAVQPAVQPEPPGGDPDGGVVVRPTATEPRVTEPVQPDAPAVLPQPPVLPEQPVVQPEPPVVAVQPEPPAVQPEPPVVAVQPEPPAVEPAPPAVAVEPDPPVKPAVTGPRPDAPGTGGEGGPLQLPEELRPMLPVAFFFTDAEPEVGAWPASTLEATWSTNQGERSLDDVELKEHFELVDGHRLPVVAVTDPGRESTVLALRVKQPGFAWWVARIGQPEWEITDLAAYLRNGRLELAIRGAEGEESLRIGVFDRANPAQVALVPISQFGTITTDWQVIRIPLRALKSNNPDLDWSRIGGLQLASAHGRPLQIWLDDLRVVNPAGGE